MMPPSLTDTGGSSSRAELSISPMSDISSISENIFLSRAESKVESSCFTGLINPTDCLKARRSSGFALLLLNLASSLSRSYMGLRYSDSSSLSINLSLSSSTASCLDTIASFDNSGWEITRLISLDPMAVPVLSSTQSRVPFFSLSRMVSSSSRLRMVEVSITMYSELL